MTAHFPICLKTMKLNRKFRRMLQKARYKSLRGGRGGMKSWAVAALLIEIARRGRYRFLCARELQNSIGDSVITLLSDTIERLGYTAEFEVQRNRLICLHTGTEFLFYGIKKTTQQKSNPLKALIFAGWKKRKTSQKTVGTF